MELNEVVISDRNELNSPFYYDRVSQNYITTVSLHPNTVIKYDDKNKEKYEWVAVKNVDQTNTDDDGYSYDSIIRIPYLDDFVLTSQNNWSEFGEDEIGKTWNSFKPWEPYLRKGSEYLGKMLGITQEKRNDPNSNISKSFIGGFIENLLSGTKNLVDKSAGYMGRSLVSQAARFSYYSGTSTTFGNLSMKFTVFSGWDIDEKTGNYMWKKVDDQLQKLYPYVMGKYTNNVGNLQEGDAGMTKEQAGKVNEIINEFLAWQMPPAGFTPDLKTYDNCVYGTLKLKFGSYYSIPALVCSNAQFNFSRQMVKNWDPEAGENSISPLYCDVILNFQPSTKFSDNAIISFINSGHSGSEYMTGTIENGMGMRLDNIRKSNEDFLNGKYN